MAQSGWRLPDDLLKRVRVHCAMSGERQNAFVERALESALGPETKDAAGAVAERPAASSRTSARKAAKPSAELPKIAPRRWA